MNYWFNVYSEPNCEYVLGPRTPNPLLPLEYEQQLVTVQTGTKHFVELNDREIIITAELSKSAAVREMKEFIFQAQEALARLEAL